MKKRFFAILICLIAIATLCVFPLTVSAETEIPVAVEGTTPEAIVPDTSDTDETHTIFTRIWEFVSTYPSETLSVIGSAILMALNISLKHSNKKTSKESKLTLEDIQGNVGETLKGQDNVVDVVNKMIEAYNVLSAKYEALKESYDKYGATEDERNQTVGAVLASNSAILEILTTVYMNSKMPQGVKDLVSLKYANYLKALGDDSQLKAIFEAVHNNIRSLSEPSTSGAENTEV